MADDELHFSFDVAEIDRWSLLTDAADLLDTRGMLLADKPPGQSKTDEGKAAREFRNEDIAKLPAYPEVYRITDETFLHAGFAQVPIKFQQVAQDFSFYWIRIPVGLVPRQSWGFHRLEMYVVFNEKDEARRRPKAHAILPEKKFDDLLKSSAAVSLHLNENLEFAAGLKEVKVDSPIAAFSGKGSFDAGAMIKLGLTTGGEYRLKKAKIYHNAPGMEWVFWRLDGAEFIQEDSPVFIVITQVPNDATEIRIGAKIIAYRYFSYLTSSLQEAIAALPENIRNFFMGGVPAWDDKLKAPWIINLRP